MLNQTNIGLDIGRSAVKATAFADGKYYNLIFDSIVAPAIELSDESTERRAELETVTVAGTRYFTGDTARLQASAGTGVGLSNDWISGPEYLALVASAIKRLEALGVPGLHDPYVVIGTPSSLYNSQRELIKQETEKVLRGQIKVLPQPMGAYCEHAFNKNGSPKMEVAQDSSGRKRSWGVIEGGHFTTDFLLMLEGQYIERAANSCEGASYAAEHLMRILGRRNIQATQVECSQAIRTRTILQYGQDIDVSAEVDEAVAHVAQKIFAKSDAVFGSEVRKLSGVILAGGTAPLLYAAMKAKWPHSVMLEDSRMAVANGFCKYAMAQSMRKVATHKTAVAANGN